MVFCCKLPRKSFVIFTIVSIRKFAKQVTRKNANFLWQRFGCQKTIVSKIPYRNECDTTCHSAENFQNQPWPSPFSNKRYETFCDRFPTHSFKYILGSAYDAWIETCTNPSQFVGKCFVSLRYHTFTKPGIETTPSAITITITPALISYVKG